MLRGPFRGIAPTLEPGHVIDGHPVRLQCDHPRVMGLVLASKQKHFDVGLSVSARDICGDGEFGVNRGADLLDRALFPFSCVPTKIVTLIWWAAISRIAGLPEGRDKAAASQPPVKCRTRALARQRYHTPRSAVPPGSRPSTLSESLRVFRFEASGFFLTLHEWRCGAGVEQELQRAEADVVTAGCVSCAVEVGRV